MKPFSEACERNKQPILDVISPLLETKTSLLEIGSGNGQHAVYFSQEMPHLTWQTSDRLEYHPAINLWIDDATNPNILRPIELDVLESVWPTTPFDVVFTANTAHIMPWQAVEAMIRGVAKLLTNDGLLIIYGPFNYNGQFTSESNARFELWLKEGGEHQGIRDFKAVDKLANQNGLRLRNDFEMPANNRMLIFAKSCNRS